jgi:ribosomal protein S15P/S13E
MWDERALTENLFAGLAPEIPEDLYQLIKKAVSVRKHLERNKKDKDSKFRLILIESRIHRCVLFMMWKNQAWFTSNLNSPNWSQIFLAMSTQPDSLVTTGPPENSMPTGSTNPPQPLLWWHNRLPLSLTKFLLNWSNPNQISLEDYMLAGLQSELRVVCWVVGYSRVKAFEMFLSETVSPN